MSRRLRFCPSCSIEFRCDKRITIFKLERGELVDLRGKVVSPGEVCLLTQHYYEAHAGGTE